MSAISLSRQDFTDEDAVTSRNDLRVEVVVKNNVLWKAIHRKFRSVSSFCRRFRSLRSAQTPISELLRFKMSPFKQEVWMDEGEEVQRVVYRTICYRLERILKIPVEDLFPLALYRQFLGKETLRVLEIDSFTALPGTVRQQIRLLAAPEEVAPLKVVTDKELAEKINYLLKSLTYREREIIKLRYGLGDAYSYTLEEVGKIFKVDPVRVRQIEAKAIGKLRHPIRAKHLRDFLDLPPTSPPPIIIETTGKGVVETTS